MRRLIFLLLFIKIPIIHYGQLIADHTVVDRYDDIPEQYLAEVKKMWLTVPGESHSVGYRAGLTLLESLFPAYDVNITESGTPEAYTTAHLRASGGFWGDILYDYGWRYGYGEEDWFTSALAISRTKAGITYANTNNFTIGAMGFGWCYDLGVSAVDYSNATHEYVTYCTTNGYTTKVFFTTGPVDLYKGEEGYSQHLKYEYIRNFVTADPTRILFDYADILCYDDNGTSNSTSWDGHIYPIITSTNLGDASIAHIGSAGVLRLAKAMWWMLARISGWDGVTTDIKKDKFNEAISVLVDDNSDEIKINVSDNYLSGQLVLYNMQGLLIESKRITNNDCIFNKAFLPSGLYFIKASKLNMSGTKKILIFN